MVRLDFIRKVFILESSFILKSSFTLKSSFYIGKFFISESSLILESSFMYSENDCINAGGKEQNKATEDLSSFALFTL